mmetsp:Transcript_17259/g.38043  ORF Transcript_17259/g.38043 Transcript_17259/m.38043 type:complete len:259 (+) Transcript_17259:23-799(+)
MAYSSPGPGYAPPSEMQATQLLEPMGSKAQPVGLHFQRLYFAAAVVVTTAGVVAAVDLILNAASQLESPFDFLNSIYLVCFGLLMVVLDFPFTQGEEKLAPLRAHIYKFALFLTRKLGRGLWYFFLGAFVFATLWDNSISAFLAVALGGFCGVVGLVACWGGFLLSQKLKVAQEALSSGNFRLDMVRRDFPNGFSSPEAFNEVIQKNTGNAPGGAVSFSDEELVYVMNGLRRTFSPASSTVDLADFEEWLSHPGWTVV